MTPDPRVETIRRALPGVGLERCPKCWNMDGGCPFCGHGYVKTVEGEALDSLARDMAEWKTDREHLVAAQARADRMEKALRPIVREYDLWSEDANDGEFRLWDLDRLVVAIVAARAALADTEKQHD